MLTMVLLAVAAARASPDPCALLTRAEVTLVQGEEVRDARASHRTEGALAINSCLWTLPTYSRSVAFEVATAEPDVIDAVWRRIFHGERRDEEREGKGLSHLIERALSADIPVVIAVPSHRFAEWIKFADGMSVKLRCDRGSLDAWWCAVSACSGSFIPQNHQTVCEVLK